MPLNIFISYAHADEPLYERLAKHLKPLEYEGLIHPWHDREMTAGREFGAAIASEMERADVVLLLISPDFVSSAYCWGIEMKTAMARHEAGTARVIPVILRPVDWHRCPFGKLLALPKDGKPVTLWSDQDEALVDVTTSIRRMIDDLTGQSASDSPVPLRPRVPTYGTSGGQASSYADVKVRYFAPSFIPGKRRDVISVFVDDVFMTTIGETDALIRVSPGRHSIHTRFMMRKSNNVFIDARAGEQFVLECGSSLLNENQTKIDWGRALLSTMLIAPAFYLKRIS